MQFRTVHSSKGLEADYVIILTRPTGRYGFPSEIADDPILALAMVEAELFENAEERRLFYVALTRARKEVIVIAPSYPVSPFVTELLEDKVPLVGGLSLSDPVRVCKKCHAGLVVIHNDSTRCSGYLLCGLAAGPVKVCEKCAAGTMVVRVSEYGQFFGCTRYPHCKNTRNI